MDIKLLNTAYTFKYMGKIIIVEVKHLENCREVVLVFNDKPVKKATVNIEDTTSDAECIHMVTEEFLRATADKYVDIIKNHANKIFLISKKSLFSSENWGFTTNLSTVVTKGNYLLRISIDETGDYVESSIKATSFSEALEKMRLCSSLINGLSTEFTAHLDQIVSDRVLNEFSWEEN